MKSLWTYIEKKKWRADKKYRAALLLFGSVFALIGFALWLIVRIWALSTWDWMVCFVGYPIAASWLAVFFYSNDHAFHDGEYGG